ncbi:MAG: DUF4156 domain-containing protein [Oligoflexia bacterium]|nr:DUF4156 domain-containing protein [Oligoflexia bacterium]
MKTWLGVILVSLFAFGCSTAELSSKGSSVEIVSEISKQNCKNIGPVFGKGGGSFGGAWISDEKLMEYAYNDLRNKAAEKGATHVVSQGHQMGQTTGQYGGSTSTATISGVAYRCAN